MDAVKVQSPVNNCTAPAEPGEEWRLINDPRISRDYWISNYGRVWSEKSHIFLKTHIKNGYETLYITNLIGGSSFFIVHRLVACAFLDKASPDANVVDHIDGNKRNNRAENLRWCTQKENAHNGITRPKNVDACITVSAMKGHAIKCEGFEEPFPSAKALADKLGVTEAAVRQACRKGWTVGGSNGWNNGKGFHVEYLMNTFDAVARKVTISDAIQAAKDPLIRKGTFQGTPVLCVEDNLPFPSVSAAAKAYKMSIPSLLTNKQRTDSGVSNQPTKKGFRTTYHFKSLSRDAYLDWVIKNVPQEG